VGDPDALVDCLTFSSHLGPTMVFYAFLGVLVLALVLWAIRSPLVKAHLRGRGSDPGKYRSGWDDLADRGFEPSWNDDGNGGRRESNVQSKHPRPS